MSSVAPHQLFITIVHGTWPDGLFRTLLGRKRRTYWFDNGSSFCTRLSAGLGGIPHKIKSLRWGGENSVYKRDEVALRLAEDLSTQHKEHPQATQLVIAHSHGGNIALRALHHLHKREDAPACGKESANPLVVTLATPFVEIHPADLGSRSFLVRLALVSALVLPLSIFASPVLNSVADQPYSSTGSLLGALLLCICALVAWGWYWIGRGAARQQKVELLSDATRLGETPSGRRLCVIRAVDEAHLVMALGTILTYIFTTLIALSVVVVNFLPTIANLPLMYILLNYSTVPSGVDRVEYAFMLEAWYRHAFTFGCSALVIAMFGALIVSRLVHGQELAKSPLDCQINTQSAPDAAGLTIVTLVSHKHEKFFGRHGIYEHDNCDEVISDWVRAQLGARRQP